MRYIPTSWKGFLRALRARVSRPRGYTARRGPGPWLETLEDRTAPAGHTLPTATPLVSGDNYSASLSDTLPAGQVDYYEVDVTDPALLAAQVVVPSGSSLTPHLALLDATGQQLIQSEGPAANSRTAALSQHLTPGTYYLTVSASAIPGPQSVGGAYQILSALVPATAPFQSFATSMTPGETTGTAAIGDFNGDGRLDLAVPDPGDNGVAVLLGQGDGTFSPPVIYPTGPNPDAVAVADFNGDGFPDLAVAYNGPTDGSAPGGVSILFGDGHGHFTPGGNYVSGIGADSVAAADFNGDGHPDLAVTNFLDGTVSILLNNGDGTFANAVDYPADVSPVFPGVPPCPYDVVVGDFNGDGIPDLAIADSYLLGSFGAGSVSVLLGNGDGTFSPPTDYFTGGTPFSLVVGDFNGDGHQDIAVSSTVFGTVTVLSGDGTGNFPGINYYNAGTFITSIAAGDFNGDGHTDLVVANPIDNSLSVLTGQGDGTFATGAPIPAGTSPLWVGVGDFNGDGRPDLVVTSSVDGSATVLFGNGDGTFSSFTYAAGTGPEDVIAGDFGGDGGPDLVVADAGNFFYNSPSGLSVLRGDGDGTFTGRTFVLAGGPNSAFSSVAVGDFNGDGRLDFAMADGDAVLVYLGNGDGTFAPPLSFPTGPDPVAVVAGDFFGDGYTDLAVADAGSAFDDIPSDVTLFRNNGDGTFGQGVVVATGVDFTALAVGDFYGDGRTDLAVLDSGPGTLMLLQNEGGGNFQVTTSESVGTGAGALAVADFDGDGRPNLAVTNEGASTVTVLRNAGDGNFVPTTYPTGPDPTAVVAGNFTGDGRADLAVTYTGDFGGTAGLNLFQNDGDGTFTDAGNYDVGNSPAAVAAYDLNGDGLTDLAVVNLYEGTVSVLLGQPGGFRASEPGTGDEIRNTPLLGDLDGDGTADTVVLNSSGEILFRKGVPGEPGQFEAPRVLNPGRPARDITLFHTASGLEVAAADQAGNTVSIYAVGPDDSPRLVEILHTGNLPARIVAANLDGNPQGLDDLIVANAFDDTLTIAFQSPGGGFGRILTRPVGSVPSDITVADLGGGDGPDILVSDEQSGDVTVLYNDPTHSFTGTARFRAGAGPFGLIDGPDGSVIQSQLQSVGLAAAPFTGSGDDDLVVINGGTHSLSLLRGDGEGGFLDPAPALPDPTSDQPGQAVVADFNGDGWPDLAVLMEDVDQVWVYLNNGDGTFAPPIKIDAGTSPTGLSLDPHGVAGFTDLLVGNPYGDVLRLVGDGTGNFSLDRSGLDSAPLAVFTGPDGGRYVVVADQSRDTLSVYSLGAGGRFAPAPPSVTAGLGDATLVAPGAVQLADLNGKNPYLIVASTLSNQVLVYPQLPDGSFGDPVAYDVGDDPIAIAVGNLSGHTDGVLDLAVANQGSNDVSILLGSVDPTTGAWTASAGPRLKAGGFGPLAVAVVLNKDSDHGPDLVVTNQSADPETEDPAAAAAALLQFVTLAPAGGANPATQDPGAVAATLPGIGSNGKGTGFFNDSNVKTVSLPPLAPLPMVFDPATEFGFAVTADGGVVSFDLTDSRVSQVVPDGAGVTAVGGGGDLPLFAGLVGGSVALVKPDGEFDADNPEFVAPGEPSALEVLQDAEGVEVFGTVRGGTPFFFAVGPPVAVPEQAPIIAVAEVATVPGSPLALVAALLPGPATAEPAANVTAGGRGVDATAGAAPAGRPGAAADRLLDGGGDEAMEPGNPPPERDAGAAPQAVPDRSGVGQALDRLLDESFKRDEGERARTLERELLERLPVWWKPPSRPVPKTDVPGQSRVPPAEFFPHLSPADLAWTEWLSGRQDPETVSPYARERVADLPPVAIPGDGEESSPQDCVWEWKNPHYTDLSSVLGGLAIWQVAVELARRPPATRPVTEHGRITVEGRRDGL